MVLMKYYMELKDNEAVGPVQGKVRAGKSAVFAVFDGMGGEERGEMAAYIAASTMAGKEKWSASEDDLTPFCIEVNNLICRFAQTNQVRSMGTTAAILKFGDGKIRMCNIGDSRVYRFTDDALQQVSRDHVSIGIYGRKPPLSQNLGIPEEEFLIEPYETTIAYRKNDRYLICSDGLTDMVTDAEIAEALAADPTEGALGKLLRLALERGGRDNITMVLCRVKKTLF